MKMQLILGLGLAVASAPLAAQSSVKLSRAVFVERISPENSARVIEPAGSLRSGETVLLVVEWRSTSTNKPFTVSSPIPEKLQYRGSSHDGQLVSVDGGKSWGRIGFLRVGSRLASVEDVTHLRWNVSSRTAARRRGQMTFSAIVR